MGGFVGDIFTGLDLTVFGRTILCGIDDATCGGVIIVVLSMLILGGARLVLTGVDVIRDVATDEENGMV